MDPSNNGSLSPSSGKDGPVYHHVDLYPALTHELWSGGLCGVRSLRAVDLVWGSLWGPVPHSCGPGLGVSVGSGPSELWTWSGVLCGVEIKMTVLQNTIKYNKIQHVSVRAVLAEGDGCREVLLSDE